MNNPSLRTLIVKYFSSEEIVMLCFDLDVPYQNLGSSGLEMKVQELIGYLERRNRLHELLDYCQLHRPNVSWPTLATLQFADQPPVVEQLDTQPAPSRREPWLKRWFLDWTGYYKKQYFTYITTRYRYIDLKGLTTSSMITPLLTDVFVELGVHPESPHNVPMNPLAAPRHMGQRDIWQFLRYASLTHHHLVVIGVPGSGKTTLLKMMSLALTEPARRRKYNAPNKLPILLSLRNHAPFVESIQYTLVEAIGRELAGSKDVLPAPWFDKQLKRGRCLILLDGLDEVADVQVRTQVVRWVEGQMQMFPRNRFILTSRPLGYLSNRLEGVIVLEVQPFTGKQVQDFIKRWYMAIERIQATQTEQHIPSTTTALKGATDLIARIQASVALSDLAVNPLLLTMIAMVHLFRSTLPARRVELYAEICEVFLGRRQEGRGMLFKLSPMQKEAVLRPLAYYMMVHDQRTISEGQAVEIINQVLKSLNSSDEGKYFLQMIYETSGLVLENETGMYSFAHVTFQEYMAAAYFFWEKRDVTELVQHIDEIGWHETIRLYCALTDATPVIVACLSSEKPSVDILRLAVECEEEARTVEPSVRQQLTATLNQGVEDPSPKRRTLIAEVLLSLRLRRFRRLTQECYIDDRLVSNAEYQLFLDNMYDQGNYLCPDHWRSERFAPGTGRGAVTGLRPTDVNVFCQWLTARSTTEWQFEIPLPEHLEGVAPDGAYWVWGGAERGFQLENSPRGEYQPLDWSQWLATDKAVAKQYGWGSGQHSDLAEVLTLMTIPEPSLSLLEEMDDHLSRRGVNLERPRRVDLHPIARASAIPFALLLSNVLGSPFNSLLASFINERRAPTIAAMLHTDPSQRLTGLTGFVIALSYGIERALDRRAQQQTRDVARWYVRFASWIGLTLLLQSQDLGGSASRLREPGWQSTDTVSEAEIVAHEFLSLLIDFIVLEERIRGGRQAFEGIRVIRKRIEGTTSPDNNL